MMFYQINHITQTAKNRWQTALMRRGRRVLGIILTASLLSLGLPTGVRAGDCTLDPTFNRDGKLNTNFSSNQNNFENIKDIALQADGKIIAAGNTQHDGGYDQDFALARYHPDGSLDKTFDSDGKQTLDFFGSDERADAIVLQPDGKIVLVGYTYQITTVSTSYFALARYNTDGSLDSTFDSDGKLNTGIGDGNTVHAKDAVLQPDGKIVVAGTAGSNLEADIAVVRYNTDGSLDTGFGTGGKVLTDFQGGIDGGTAVVLQPDGHIVVAGYAYSDTGGADFALARYHPDGSLDDTFGSGGKLTTDFVPDELANDLVLQADGKLVVAGETSEHGSFKRFVMARYNTDGSLDDTFDTDGKLISQESVSIIVRAIALQPDGKIVAAGGAGFFTQTNIVVARFNTDGSFDTSFGTGGKVLTDFFGRIDHAEAIAIQPDGNIIVGGQAGFSGGRLNSYFETDFALVRYFGSMSSALPVLKSLTISLPIAPGGFNRTGYVTICAPAPAGGLTVMLSDTLNSITVPERIRIPEGKTTVWFKIKLTPVVRKEAGHIIARLGDRTERAQVVVQPTGVGYLSLSPNPVEGSKVVTGVVGINAPAPEGGLIVTLSSSNPATARPTVSRITIPEGLQYKSFTVRTFDVPLPSSTIIKAKVSTGGSSRSRVLNVN